MPETETALVPGSAPLMQVFDSEDIRIGIAHWPLKGDPAVVADALDNEPKLLTKIVWEAMELPDRLAAAREGSIQADNIVSNDMTRVFSEKTMRFVSAWQTLINSHAVWHADYEIGALAHQLISRGFLMAARETGTSWHDHPVSSRYEFIAGLPGSPQFVAAMMGAEYAQWLDKLP